MEEGLQESGGGSVKADDDHPARRGDREEREDSGEAGARIPDWLAKKLFKIFS